jgi:hypothetical protein
VTELRRIPAPADAPAGGRRPLAELDAATRTSITAAGDAVDGPAAPATWTRARGIALHQAAALIPYYSVSNPAFAELGRRTVAEVIADHRAD